MRWVKRGLWIAAWGAWSWLGVGLYRELPRELASKVCEFPLSGAERLVGFVKGQHELLVEPTQYSRPIVLKVFNADVGGLTRDLSLGDRLLQLPLTSARTHGVIVARGAGRQMTGLEVLDLGTGTWTRVTDKLAVGAALHLHRPWLLFRETAGPADQRRSLAVVDWTTGTEVFALPQRPDVAVGAAFFLGDGDQLAIPVVRTAPSSTAPPSPDLEVWRIGPPARLERTLRVPGLETRPHVGGAGRIAWRRNFKEIVVHDLDADHELLSLPLDPEVVILPGAEKIHLSRSGHTLVAGKPPVVWDIDANALRWVPPPGRNVERAVEADDAFAALERWDQPWTRGKLMRWDTVALRGLDDSNLRFRCWAADAPILDHRSDDGELGVAVGPKNWLTVRSRPFRVNWLLLALCQTILALPLTLLWFLLHLRGRRATRRQLVVPTA